MDLVPDRAVDDAVMLAGIAVALVHRLTNVGAVVQQPVQVFLVDPVATAGLDAPHCQFPGQFRA